MNQPSRLQFAVAAMLAIEWFVAAASCSAAQTVAISSVPADSAAADCLDAGVSADGRFVVFVSQADNLVLNDSNGAFDVFVRDRALGKTILASVNRDGTHSGNAVSLAGTISSDGRFVAFESSASDLVAGDTNNASDIFVRDLVAGTTTLVSVSTNGVSSGNGASSWPVMTPDGRFILFESRASDLDRNDNNGAADLFVRDMTAGTTTLVTRDRFGTLSALGGGPVIAEPAQISDDGRWVAFSSSATNLIASDNNNRTDVFVRDLLNRTNILVSVSTNGLVGNRDSFSPALSADGRFVAFESIAGNLVPNSILVTNRNVYVRDLVSRTTALVSVSQAGAINFRDSSFGPVISADGRYVAFQSLANDLVSDDSLPTNFVPALDVFVRDLQSGTTTLASTHSVQTNGDSIYCTNWTRLGNERSALPVSISRDGRFILFQSAGGEATVTNTSGSNTVFTTFLPGSYLFDQTTGTRTRISLATFPASSEDGKTVAFQSPASDQLANDLKTTVNIFARDLTSGSTELISCHDPGAGSLTGNALSQLTPGSVSADGRFVAYETFAADLVASDTNGTSDVFVRDLITVANELISANAGLTGTSRGPSRLPVISGNGRWVAYETVPGDDPLTNGLSNPFDLMTYDRINRTNLLIASVGPTDRPGAPSTPMWSSSGRYLAFQSSWPDPMIPNSALGQVYLRDLMQGTNVLVSLNQTGTGGGNKSSWNPLITADGSRVLFLSAATDLVTNSAGIANLFLWDAATRSNTLVSIGTNGAGLNNVRQAAISADGRFAAFLDRTDLYLCDLAQPALSLIDTDAWSVSLSADGRFVAFESANSLAGMDTNLFNDVYVLDRLSNTVVLASVNLDGTASGNGKSTSPRITPDGRYVVFTSQASDLAPNDTNGFTDVFLRDLVAGTTTLLSADFSVGSSGNRLSGNPVLSADGAAVLFESYSSDLTVGDFNGTKDLFVFRLSAGDSDADGLPDDWELAYFNDLSRDGTGDFDGDGQSDLDEFRAGTDPTNGNSVFRAFTLSGPDPANGMMVLWNAVTGRTYRVQYKDGIGDPDWTDVPGDVIATSATATKLDSSIQTIGKRFYRVKALP